MPSFDKEQAFTKDFNKAKTNGAKFSFDTDTDSGEIQDAAEFIDVAKETDGYIVLHTKLPHGITTHLHFDNNGRLVQCTEYSSHKETLQYYQNFLAA